jgi:hypothetical protein
VGERRPSIARSFPRPRRRTGASGRKTLKSERAIVEQLGAKLVAVEVEGGKLVVPEVTDSTVLGHLATMHGVRFDGVSFAEAKVWAKANPADPTPLSEVFTMLELEKAYATHDAEHVDFAALSRPHWHREKAPR